jgi:hypothetical protein
MHPAALSLGVVVPAAEHDLVLRAVLLELPPELDANEARTTAIIGQAVRRSNSSSALGRRNLDRGCSWVMPVTAEYLHGRDMSAAELAMAAELLADEADRVMLNALALRLTLDRGLDAARRRLVRRSRSLGRSKTSL